jgi:hypothetical protein
MRVSKAILPLLLVLTFSCKKEILQEVVYDNIIYHVDTVAVYESGLDKDRLKTPLQFISSVYSNLYFSSIPTNILDNLVVYRLSIGDKNLVNEMIINAMLEDPIVLVNVPTNEEMRNNVDEFISTTYLRFFLRYPTEYEEYILREMINNDPDMLPTDIYRAFLLSNEYQFY